MAGFVGLARKRADFLSTGCEQRRGLSHIGCAGISADLQRPLRFFASSYAGLVGEIAIEGCQGYYNMNGFAFDTTAVPEPSSNAPVMLGLGVVGLSAARHPEKS